VTSRSNWDDRGAAAAAAAPFLDPNSSRCAPTFGNPPTITQLTARERYG
jgi:hypothetical protein